MKLKIGDSTVEVDDSFGQLSPEEQNATVEEIAASLPAKQDNSVRANVAEAIGPFATSAVRQLAKIPEVALQFGATMAGPYTGVRPQELEEFAKSTPAGEALFTAGQPKTDIEQQYLRDNPVQSFLGEFATPAVLASRATKALNIPGKYAPVIAESVLGSQLTTYDSPEDRAKAAGIAAAAAPVAQKGLELAGKGLAPLKKYVPFLDQKKVAAQDIQKLRGKSGAEEMEVLEATKNVLGDELGSAVDVPTATGDVSLNNVRRNFAASLDENGAARIKELARAREQAMNNSVSEFRNTIGLTKAETTRLDRLTKVVYPKSINVPDAVRKNDFVNRALQDLEGRALPEYQDVALAQKALKEARATLRQVRSGSKSPAEVIETAQAGLDDATKAANAATDAQYEAQKALTALRRSKRKSVPADIKAAEQALVKAQDNARQTLSRKRGAANSLKQAKIDAQTQKEASITEAANQVAKAQAALEQARDAVSPKLSDASLSFRQATRGFGDDTVLYWDKVRRHIKQKQMQASDAGDNTAAQGWREAAKKIDEVMDGAIPGKQYDQLKALQQRNLVVQSLDKQLSKLPQELREGQAVNNFSAYSKIFSDKKLQDMVMDLNSMRDPTSKLKAQTALNRVSLWIKEVDPRDAERVLYSRIDPDPNTGGLMRMTLTPAANFLGGRYNKAVAYMLDNMDDYAKTIAEIDKLPKGERLQAFAAKLGAVQATLED